MSKGTEKVNVLLEEMSGDGPNPNREHSHFEIQVLRADDSWYCLETADTRTELRDKFARAVKVRLGRYLRQVEVLHVCLGGHDDRENADPLVLAKG